MLAGLLAALLLGSDSPRVAIEDGTQTHSPAATRDAAGDAGEGGDPDICSCSPGLVCCGGECVDIVIDASHCGACGNPCGPEQQCSAGACTPAAVAPEPVSAMADIAGSSTVRLQNPNPIGTPAAEVVLTFASTATVSVEPAGSGRAIVDVEIQQGGSVLLDFDLDSLAGEQTDSFDEAFPFFILPGQTVEITSSGGGFHAEATCPPAGTVIASASTSNTTTISNDSVADILVTSVSSPGEGYTLSVVGSDPPDRTGRAFVDLLGIVDAREDEGAVTVSVPLDATFPLPAGKSLTLSGSIEAGAEVSCAASGAGTVPGGDDVPGTPLTVDRAGGGDIKLTWGASCVASDSDYAVYEGLLGDFASHVPVGAPFCTTAGATTATITPAGGDRYYLVVPQGDEREGSYGTDSGGTSRPASFLACRAQLVEICD